MPKKSPWALLLQPKNWIFAPILGLFRLLVFLPYRTQMQLGQALGRLLFIFDYKGKPTACVNLQLCFPHLSTSEQKKLLKKSYLHLGMSVMETALAWFGTDKQMPPLKVHGLEHWKKCHDEKRGTLLISAHLNCLEIVGRLLQRHANIAAVYRPQKLAIMDAFARYYRAKSFSKIISRQDLRHLIRSLKEGDAVWYTPDIDAGSKNSIFVPFFNVPAATITTTSRLTHLGDAVGMTIFFYRNKNLTGYDLYFSPPLENFPSGDDAADAIRVNQLIEEAICKHPEQYLWQYKRFKTRPPGEKRLYSGSKSR